jgi:hypothetical protein
MMMAGTLAKRTVAALVLATGWAISAQAQIMYAGPGTIVQQQFWNPQVYGYRIYPYLATGPYAYSFVVPPGGAVLTPQGYVPYSPGSVPQPFAYGYPPNLYRPYIPRSYGPPPQPHRGYQPGPNRPRFANPYDPPVPQRQSTTAQDNATQPQRQDQVTVPTARSRRPAATDPVNRRAGGRTKEPQPQGHVVPGGGAQDRPGEPSEPTAERKPESTAAQAEPNEPAN